MPLLAQASYQGVVSAGFLWSNRSVPVLMALSSCAGCNATIDRATAFPFFCQAFRVTNCQSIVLINNNNDLQAFQLIDVARYCLGSVYPCPGS